MTTTPAGQKWPRVEEFADADTGWMSQALCAFVPLPWTADLNLLHVQTAGRMRRVCVTCPVFEQCAMHADAIRATGGWWAGGSPAKARQIGARLRARRQTGHDAA